MKKKESIEFLSKIKEVLVLHEVFSSMENKGEEEQEVFDRLEKGIELLEEIYFNCFELVTIYGDFCKEKEKEPVITSEKYKELIESKNPYLAAEEYGLAMGVSLAEAGIFSSKQKVELSEEATSMEDLYVSEDELDELSEEALETLGEVEDTIEESTLEAEAFAEQEDIIEEF